MDDTLWRKLRLNVLERDAYTCAMCGDMATVVDHIVCHAEGGQDEMWNLQSLCDYHHKEKTKEEARRGRDRRPTRTRNEFKYNYKQM